MSLVAFRCDGGARLGVGHVARSLQVALAFRMGGDEVVFAGDYAGLAAAMLSEAGVATAQELPADAGAVVVDSYEVEPRAVEALASRFPVAMLSDGGRAPPRAAVLDYHPDAKQATLGGTAYAPVAPACIGGRRERGFTRALVTVGGGETGAALRESARAALWRHGLEVLEPSGSPGLHRQLHAADVAISAAGVTAYELACAGVPTALVPVAANQERVVDALATGGLAVSGRGVGELVALLVDARVRELLAVAGPAAVDGYGAFRARDGLRAAFAGRAVPDVLTYRPALAADSERQLAWRNDPAVRAASWQTAEVMPGEHARWFEGVLSNPLRTLLVIEGRHGPLGSIRFDGDGDEAKISVIVAPEGRGSGTGSKAIRETSELFLAAYPLLARIRAELRADNLRSEGAFRRAGFEPAQGRLSPERAVLTLDRPALASGRP